MNKSKMTRRMCTAALASALAIALSSCSGATNTYGKLDEKKDTVYASSNGYDVTYGELWDELQWSSESVLEEQITNVVLQKYFTNIYNVMNKNFADLTADELTAVGITKDAEGAEDSFNALKKEYGERLVDYVIQDVFNLTFDIAGYDSAIKNLESYNKLLYENKYVDNIYTTYHVSKIGNTDLEKLVVLEKMGADVSYKDNFDNYLAIANSEELRHIYYVDYAKELLAFDALTEEVEEANEDDEDDDDDMWGYFSTSDYISMYKQHYTSLNKVNAILVKFTSVDEFEQTLRAFGIRYYKDKFYFIDATSDTMSYDDYIKYYDDFQSSQLANKSNVEAIDDKIMVEIYTQIYNYYYGGYRTPLETGNVIYNASTYKLDKLRTLTRQIIEDYSIDTDDKYENAIKNLTENYTDTESDTFTVYSKEYSDDISKSLTNFLHDTLSVEDYSKRYSSSTTSINNGYYIGYKLADQKLTEDDDEDYETLQTYLDFYNSDRSNYEILTFIQNKDLQDTVEKYLKIEKLTEANISNYVKDTLEDVKVKIYNEPTEIAYLAAHSTYSKTLSKASDSNLIASITYDDVTYNVQIVADNTAISNDTDTVKTLTIPGNPEKAFGVFDQLERTSGATTAIDLISKKLVKTTKAYESKSEDREKYLDYIDSLLYQFSNGAFESSGYPSSIGKYNFLMLYFHTAVIDEIIDNYYKIQFASVDLLTDYSSDTLINFFMDYSQNIYDSFFSLSGTRMVVYFDGNDDDKADLTTDTTAWQDHVITADESDEFAGKTREYVAKQMITEIYTLLAASTKSHSDRLSEIVTEIQGSAKVEYENTDNPLAAENRWAKYLHVGLKVKTEDLSVSNTSTDVDFAIKQRVYDYARGTNTDGTKTYQYFLNQTTPTCFIETLTDASLTNDDIVKSEDGYNLLLITSGTAKSSAEFTEKKNSESILTDIYFKYNDNNITIENIYNDGEQLNKNQVKYYVLDYAINNSSTIIPTSLADAYNNYLSGIVTRFTGSETQRIVLLSFIRNKAGLASDTEFYNVVKFDNAAYNGADGIFNNFILINQKNADSYNYIYDDTTGTSNPYSTWWDEISKIVDSLLLKDKEA